MADLTGSQGLDTRFAPIISYELFHFGAPKFMLDNIYGYRNMKPDGKGQAREFTVTRVGEAPIVSVTAGQYMLTLNYNR